ncbi:hypothetical protein Cgig2_019068 [Carnegiea gigantea]|uniref:Uncharacterized protein n=1 Tax=Carnegiea gigantea TaxID=171969 RepID=A0A9Q1KF23_9CARY|nr:hypothetical protein Cgig2_019068 [Carnegiea gigantea]
MKEERRTKHLPAARVRVPTSSSKLGATGSGKKIENLLPLPFSESFSMSSLLPTTLRSKNLLSIATNFLQHPLIHNRGFPSSRTEETIEQDSSLRTPQKQIAGRRLKSEQYKLQERGNGSPELKTAEPAPPLQCPVNEEAKTVSRRNSLRWRLLEVTETSGQPGLHDSRVNPTHMSRSEKIHTWNENPSNESKRRPVKGLLRFPVQFNLR